jgi:hypothetical protein
LNLELLDRQVYAATDEYEYFAELSVADLATNDGFPRDRESLAAYDRNGYQLMATVWGDRDAQDRPIVPPKSPTGKAATRSTSQLHTIDP